MQTQKLNEAFSDSMPRWLRDRLYGDNFKNQKSKEAHGVDYFDTDNYGARTSGTKLLQLLLDNDIDVANANFITPNEVPDKKDPILSDTNYLKFYLLDNIPDDTGIGGTTNRGKLQVYVPGYNDNEKYLLKDCAFKWLISNKTGLPSKTLMEHCIGFCYLDLNDSDNFFTTKANYRTELSKTWADDPKYNRITKFNRNNGPQTVGSNQHHLTADKNRIKRLDQKYDYQWLYKDRDFDKSGYRVERTNGIAIELINRAKEVAAKLAGKRIGKAMDDVNQAILSAQDIISNGMSLVDISNRRNISRLNKYLTLYDDCLYTYQVAVQRVADIQSSTDGESYKNEQYLYVTNSMIKPINEKLKLILDFFKDYEPGYIEW